MPFCCFTCKFPRFFFFSSIRFMSFAASLDFRRPEVSRIPMEKTERRLLRWLGMVPPIRNCNDLGWVCHGLPHLDTFNEYFRLLPDTSRGSPIYHNLSSILGFSHSQLDSTWIFLGVQQFNYTTLTCSQLSAGDQQSTKRPRKTTGLAKG